LLGSLSLRDDRVLNLTIFKLYILDLLHPDTLLKICSHLFFCNEESITRLICISSLGPEKAVQSGVISAHKMAILENDINRISSQIYDSFSWLFFTVKFSSKSNYHKILRLRSRV
jgi:hypothetical protein